MKLTKNALILLAILLVAFTLRIYQLGSESLWLDEGLSILWARLSPVQLIQGISNIELQPPLYYLVLHFWINFFGDSEFSVRFLSLIFGVLAVFMIYKVGRLIFDEKTGLLGALLLAVSTFHIYFSQETRMYSLLVFLALASMYCFLKLLKEKNPVYSVGYVLSTIFLIYTQYSVFPIIIVQNIFFFTIFLSSKRDSRPSLKKWLLLQLIVVFLYAPWFGALAKQLGGVFRPDTPNDPSITLLSPPKFTIPLIIRFFTQYCGTRVLASIFFTLSFFSLVSFKKRRPHIDLAHLDKYYFLALWLFSPILLGFIPKITSILYYAKYLIANSPPLFLLAAKGLDNIRLKYLRYGVLVLLIALSLVNVREIYTKINKEPWERAVSYIEKNAQPGDLLIFTPPYFQETVFDYYSKREDLDKMGFPTEERTYPGTYPAHVTEKNIKELEPILRGHKRVWFIQSHMRDPKGLILRRLSQTYIKTYDKKYNIITFYRPPTVYVGIRVCLFERK